MSNLTIDYQDVFDSCRHCQKGFTVSRGSVYDEGDGASIYLAALHECGGGRAAHVAVAVKAGYQEFTETCAASMQIVDGGANFDVSLVDPEYSPWKDVNYLGRMLRQSEVIDSPLKNTFFHIADHIVWENPTINEYLSGGIRRR